jgi:hypothetical protein
MGLSLPSWVKAAAGGRSEDIEILDQHAILDAIHRPNRINVDWTLKYNTVSSLELTGWAYWWFPMNKGKKEIYYVPTHWIKPNHSRALFGDFSIRPEGTTEWKPLPPNSIAPFFYPDPSDPLAALSPLEANIMAVAIDEYLRRAQKSAFERGIFPKMAVILGEVPTKGGMRRPRSRKGQRAQMRAALNARLRGADRYGDYAILDSVIAKIEKISNNIDEMDFPQSSKMSEGRVARGHGVNPTITGENEGTNYAQAAVAEKLFCDLTINPKLDLLGRVMTVWVVPQFDQAGDIVLFFEPAKPNDPVQRLAEWKLSLDSGGCTLNDYNTTILGLPWREENEVYLRPLNRIEVRPGQASPKLPAPPKPSDDDEEEIDDPEPEEEGGGDADDLNPDDPPKGKRSKASQVEDISGYAGILAFYENLSLVWLRAHDARSDSFTGDLRTWMEGEADEIASTLKEAHRPASDEDCDRLARELVSMQSWSDGMKDVARKHIMHSMLVGAIFELDTFGEAPNAPEVEKPPETDRGVAVVRKDELLDLSIDIPESVLGGIREELDLMMEETYWADTSDVTVRQISEAVKDGIAAGETMREIALRVRGVLGEDAVRRAQLIAQTEVTGAINAGQHSAREYLVQEDIITGKEWTSNHDQKTRPDHVTADGQRRANNVDFELSDGSKCRYPGDRRLPAKQRCRCRCTAIATTVFSDSKVVRAARLKAFINAAELMLSG